MTVSKAILTFEGQDYDMTLGSDGMWECSFTAPSKTSGSKNNGQGPGVGENARGKGYYPIKITATDDYGNTKVIDVTDTSFGEQLKLKVLENQRPTASLTFPTQGANLITSKPAITGSVYDAGSGINPSKVFIQVDSLPAVSVSPSMSGASGTVSYTPGTALTDGSHTVSIWANDYDGNESERQTVTFKVDTVKPTLNVATPADGAKVNTASIVVSGTTNDVTSSPVSITIDVGGSSVVVDVVGGSFSKDVALSEGSNTITITATDSSGLSTVVTRNVSLNTRAPEFSQIQITDNPTGTGSSVAVKVKITDL